MEATTPATPAAPPRDMLIDVVRGLAISLVALGHTNQGMIHRGWWGTSELGTRLNIAIYAFHMPAFFFVSGVFLRPGVEKRGPRRYTIEKLRSMIYPYVLWSCIFAATTIPFARFMVQRTPSFRAFLLNLITGNASWFLPTLFFALMAGMALRRLPTPVLFLLAVVGCLFVPYSDVAFLERGIRLLPFLVAGMWMGARYRQLQAVPAAASAFLAIGCAVLIGWISGRPYGTSFYLLLPLGFAGTFMLMMLAHCLGRSAVARALAWAGAASFGIFLISSFPQGAGRELLLRGLHTSAPWPQLIFPTLLAVLVPAWLYHRRVQLHIQWMFVWPFQPRG